MSRSQGKARAVSSKGFGSSPARGAFGGFSTSSSGSSLSYLAEPPDFSSISDANVVVSFKNLLKKDSTTKAKALEDLVAYTQAHPYEQNGGTEEAVLEAWVGALLLTARSRAQIVMYNIGTIISSYFNRQFPSSPRTVPQSPTRAGEIGAKAHGEAYPEDCRLVASWHL